MPPLLTDHALSRRLERAEGSASAAFTDARAALHPGCGATWTDLHGTLAMFDGPGSFLTQSFGWALDAPATAEALDELEAFFRARGAAPVHEVSPMADPATLALFAARGYQLVDLTAVLAQELASRVARPIAAGVEARPAREDEIDTWIETASAGWGESAETAAFMRDFGPVAASARGTTCFLAFVDGAPAGAATLAMHGGVALLAGASTRPALRGRGAQGALLEARLAHARAAGCDLAMMGAAPGSASQRNAERQGFRIAYTRLKWMAGAG